MPLGAGRSSVADRAWLVKRVGRTLRRGKRYCGIAACERIYLEGIFDPEVEIV